MAFYTTIQALSDMNLKVAEICHLIGSLLLAA
jgi:hypothetical protein